MPPQDLPCSVVVNPWHHCNTIPQLCYQKAQKLRSLGARAMASFTTGPHSIMPYKHLVWLLIASVGHYRTVSSAQSIKRQIKQMGLRVLPIWTKYGNAWEYPVNRWPPTPVSQHSRYYLICLKPSWHTHPPPTDLRQTRQERPTPTIPQICNPTTGIPNPDFQNPHK